MHMHRRDEKCTMMINDDFKIPHMFSPIKSTIKIEWQRENI